MKYSLIISLIFSTQVFSQDNDHSFLDAPYNHQIRPRISQFTNKAVSKNDIELAMSFQTPVRSQESRGTCSIFSATAFLESTLVYNETFKTDIDLSEEWLQYISVRGKSSDGSSAPSNFEAMKKHGMLTEERLPYIGFDWTKNNSELKETRCSHLSGVAQTSCFITHFDPNLLVKNENLIEDRDFISLRTEALQFKKDYLKIPNTSYYLTSTEKIKNRLIQGQPVVLEIDFFYGAWNHRGGEPLGIERNLEHWNNGIVTHPEIGSLDFEKSPTKPAGHSILVVGFDDNLIIKKNIQMSDGTKKTFTYKGVYYIKNSWGKEGFGRNFQINGVNYPGYGMIVQKHANENGSFFAF